MGIQFVSSKPGTALADTRTLGHFRAQFDTQRRLAIIFRSVALCVSGTTRFKTKRPQVGSSFQIPTPAGFAFALSVSSTGD